MNEAETRAELIDPALRELGWVTEDNVKVSREFKINNGRILTGGRNADPKIADYLLTVNDQDLAVVEAKSDEKPLSEGVAQAKKYAQLLQTRFTYATNGKEILQIDMETGKEEKIHNYPTPERLWDMVHGNITDWETKFNEVPFETYSGTKQMRYYQKNAVNNVLKAIANGDQRLLLTLATGTGKTFIAFQIAWKLFYARWNNRNAENQRPRILFLADRNILADQAYNSFNAFAEDALVRIRPGKVSTSGSIFFTIFQTFMTGSGDENEDIEEFELKRYEEYPPEFFDLIIIDECHRGGAKDESNWRGIMEYFKPAVQLGLTATPRTKDNANTYKYFGKPVYQYSLKEGIQDGFLTPYKVQNIKTLFDEDYEEYVYRPGDIVVEGEVEEGKAYFSKDFNRSIIIEERERERVKKLLEEIDQTEKTLIFCATQKHALLVRDLINKYKNSENVDYCHRVTAEDGEIGEEHLRNFQDNEKSIPTILTTSQKLSTGVDARNVRNIVLFRPVGSMIEFKQIVGRGTRLFDNKDYFTIYDFEDVYLKFFDEEWDGEPTEPEVEIAKIEKTNNSEPKNKRGPKEKIIIQLSDGREREIVHSSKTFFFGKDGQTLTAQQFIEELYNTCMLPEIFESEDKLRELWSLPSTRKQLLQQLEINGFSIDDLYEIKKIIDAEKSDIFDVLEFVAFAKQPKTRRERAEFSEKILKEEFTTEQLDFLTFVLGEYKDEGFEVLDDEKLPILLELKYKSIQNAKQILGDLNSARNIFLDFQKSLYRV
jgi:type I restriction enzyme R subunit